MRPAHPNVLRAISDFDGYLAELPTAHAARRAEIRKEAVACVDLMNASYEVADIEHPTWAALDRAVSRVFVALTTPEPQ